MKQFTINECKRTNFPHYWEMCVGSCHGYTALREDYRRQLKKAHQELGFQYVRFHGLFNDDMCVCVERKEHTGKIIVIEYNFFNIDSIFDYLLSIGMKPFIEIGFMPTCLASGEETCFHYKGNITPPKDYDLWNDFIKAFTEHLIERYGLEEVQQWFFEIWNEPNLAFFFAGTQKQYFELYENTVRTIKSVSETLKVGGPATSINAWIPEMITFCESRNVPLDFVSTHHYPTDDPLWKNGDLSVEDFFKTMGNEFGKYERGIIQKMTAKTKQQAGNYPLCYTEWNTSGMAGDCRHDECYAASMIAKILADNDGLVDGYSYWTFTDIFEEAAQLKGAFHGGFGLQTVYGVEKPAYRIFELFHGMGNERYEVTDNGEKGNCEVIATKTDRGMRLIIHNHNTPDGEIYDEQVKIMLAGFDKPEKITVYKIDERNCNPKRTWEKMGSPEYLKAEQIQKLSQVSKLMAEEWDKELIFTVPGYGVVAVDIR